jgi:3-dehydrosphinganine reductase
VLSRAHRQSDILQTILLTGASEGMGLSVALRLAKKGASIIIVARNVGKLEEALGQIKVL